MAHWLWLSKGNCDPAPAASQHSVGYSLAGVTSLPPACTATGLAPDLVGARRCSSGLEGVNEGACTHCPVGQTIAQTFLVTRVPVPLSMRVRARARSRTIPAPSKQGLAAPWLHFGFHGLNPGSWCAGGSLVLWGFESRPRTLCTYPGIPGLSQCSLCPGPVPPHQAPASPPPERQTTLVGSGAESARTRVGIIKQLGERLWAPRSNLC